MTLPWQITGPFSKPLLLMPPNAIDSNPVALGRQGDEIATPQGARVIDFDPAPAIARHEWDFVCATREELAFLEAFFDARKGRADAFWFPLWNSWEFEVRGYEEPNAGSFYLWVNRTGYVEQLFPLGGAYRHVLLTWGDLYKSFGIDAVYASDSLGVDKLHMGANGDSSVAGIPSLIHLAPQNDAFRPLSLRWGRFDQDEIVVEELGEGAARIALSFLELPAEVPTS